MYAEELDACASSWANRNGYHFVFDAPSIVDVAALGDLIEQGDRAIALQVIVGEDHIENVSRPLSLQDPQAPLGCKDVLIVDGRLGNDSYEIELRSELRISLEQLSVTNNFFSARNAPQGAIRLLPEFLAHMKLQQLNNQIRQPSGTKLHTQRDILRAARESLAGLTPAQIALAARGPAEWTFIDVRLRRCLKTILQEQHTHRAALPRYLGGNWGIAGVVLRDDLSAAEKEGRLRALAAAGASLEIRGTLGRTPLLAAAASTGAIGLLRPMLELDADVHPVDERGEGLLALACSKSIPHVISEQRHDHLDTLLDAYSKGAPDLALGVLDSRTLAWTLARYGSAKHICRGHELGLRFSGPAHVNDRADSTLLHLCVARRDAAAASATAALIDTGLDSAARDGAGRRPRDVCDADDTKLRAVLRSAAAKQHLTVLLANAPRETPRHQRR
jgi:hypothetical protein